MDSVSGGSKADFLEGGWEGGGRGEGVQGDALALSRRRSCGPPVWCREENSDTDRECDSAPHPPGGAGGPQECHGNKPPDHTEDGVVQRRCHSVQMHADGDSRPWPLLFATHEQTTAHSTVLSILCCGGVFIFVCPF